MRRELCSRSVIPTKVGIQEYQTKLSAEEEPAKFLQAFTPPTTDLLRTTFGTIVCDGKTICVYHLGLFDEAPRFEEWSELAFLLSVLTETPSR